MQQPVEKAAEAAATAEAVADAELKKVLLEFIKQTGEAVKEGASQTIDFAKEQVPLVLQEIVRAEILQHVMWIGGLLCVISVLLLLARMFSKAARGEDGWALAVKDRYDFDRGDAFGFAITLRLVGAGIFVIAVLPNIYGALYAYWFPRLTIMEYVSKLVKGV